MLLRNLVGTALLIGSLHASEPAGSRDALPAPRAPKALSLALTAAQDGRVMAAGERGHVLFSDDAGAQWTQASVPVRATLTAVAEGSAGLIAAGHDGVLLRSTDRGQSWQLLRNRPEDEKPVLDLHFTDPQHGFAVGAYGLFLRSDDGGATWEEQTLPEFDLPDFGVPHLYRLTHLRDGRLLVVGEAGFLAQSVDAGRSWTRVALNYEGSLFSVLQTRTGAVLLGGMRGRLFRCECGQAETMQWLAVDTQSRSGINALLENKDGQLLAVGMDGVVLSSSNDGLSFHREQRRNRKAIADALPLPGGQWLLAAEDGLHAWPEPEPAANKSEKVSVGAKP